MPRAFVAIGVATMLGGCGVVSFGPLDGASPDGGEQPDLGPVDMGEPDTGVPVDTGPPPDLGECMYMDPPTFPAAFTSWPFIASTPVTKEVFYKRIVWDDAYKTEYGCTGATCHGYGTGNPSYPLSKDPLIPINEMLLDEQLDKAVDDIWLRIKESDLSTQTGKMYAHHQTNGTDAAKIQETWIPGNPIFDPKIAFVDRIMQNARDCATYQWFKTYESMLCSEDGSGGEDDAGTDPDPDAGVDDAGEMDAGGSGGGGGGGSDCLCRQPFEQAMSGIDMQWAIQTCAMVTPP